MNTSSCSYAAPVSRKKSQNQGDASPDEMQNRIDRLEGLVLSLMHNGGGNADSNSTNPSGNAQPGSRSVTGSASSAKMEQDDAAIMVDDDEDSDIENELAASLGVLKVDSDKGKSMYIGQEHWHTLLADISEVKNYFVSHKKELESSYERVRLSKPQVAREGPTLLLGALPSNETNLRAELPPKSKVLTLCSRYFNSMDNAVSIIHGPTFQQQLRKHWQDPNKTPIMWLGLLYAILTLAMLSYHKVGDEPPEWAGRTLDMAADFRLRTVQCLIQADYTKPVEYTVETMILYVFGEYSARWDADLGLWMIVSLITRIAYRMGYHRDAKWFPSISPFQAVRPLAVPVTSRGIAPKQSKMSILTSAVGNEEAYLGPCEDGRCHILAPSIITEHDLRARLRYTASKQHIRRRVSPWFQGAPALKAGQRADAHFLHECQGQALF
jgi:hypothetical protein